MSKKFDFTTLPVVSGLNDYIEEHLGELIAKAVVGGDTINMIRVQTGVKKNATIHVVTAAVTLQADACGWNNAGTATVSERDLEGAAIKVNMSFCPEQFRAKYAEYLLKSNAVENPLPFEEVFAKLLTELIAAEIEKLIWQGDKTSGSGNMALIDGILAIAGNDANVITDSHSTGTAYAFLKGIDKKIPEAVYGKSVIFVPPYIFRELMQDLVSANLFHYNPADELNDIVLPGTQTRVHNTKGLAGAKKVFACDPDLLVYGTDMESDSETFEFEWAKEAREWRFAASWVSAVNYAFSDLCVLGTDARA